VGLLAVVGITLLAGLATPVGGLAAWGVHRRQGRVGAGLLRALIAFGGGLLFAAIALVLVPEGLRSLPLAPALLCLVGGALLFLALDKAVQRRGGQGAQVMASALDSVPESLGLGAAFALGGSVGPVLVLLVALQNLPEGFNGFRELQESGVTRRGALAALAATSLLGPLAAAAGYLWLAPHPQVVSALFMAAAGGILYLLVQDVAPMAHQDRHWAPTLGAVLGFAVGIAAQALVG
jgi:zinc transporter, ZIP family